MILNYRRLFWLSVLVLVFTQPGCVSRRLMMQSDPPGALVLVDGEEVGFTPVSVDFTYYGKRQVTLIKDGYETLSLLQTVPPPWYQYPVVEFFSDNLLPTRVTDRQRFNYRLQPRVVSSSQDLLQRGEGLRNEAQIGR